MSNENLESRITAKKTIIDEFMGTPHVVRYSIILNERTKEGYKLMSEFYGEIANAIGTDPKFTRDSPKEAFHEFLSMSGLDKYKWSTKEGLGALVDQDLLQEGTENAFQTFVGATKSPVGRLEQRKAYITAQISGEGIFTGGHYKGNGMEIPSDMETTLKIGGVPEINGMALTVVVDTSAHEFEYLIDGTIKNYAHLEIERKPSLIEYR